jgi:EthD domain-containing protein
VEKIIYLVWKPEAVAIETFRDALLGPVAEQALAAGAHRLVVSAADLAREIPKPTLLMGDGRTLSASFDVWLDCIDDRRPIEAALRERAARVDGYLVTESVPQRCTDRDWPDGKRSPGVTHFTWFPKPARLSDEEFFRAWHEVHTPFSFELHPLRWEYVRNAVARPLTPGAPPIRAIVAERFRTLEDYTDPRRLYGSKEVLKRVMADTVQFADVADMNSTPLSETIVRS